MGRLPAADGLVAAFGDGDAERSGGEVVVDRRVVGADGTVPFLRDGKVFEIVSHAIAHMRGTLIGVTGVEEFDREGDGGHIHGPALVQMGRSGGPGGRRGPLSWSWAGPQRARGGL